MRFVTALTSHLSGLMNSLTAVRQAIIFRDKKLFVSQDKPNLRDFMEAHPGNAANGGSMFREVNKTKDAAVELEKEFLLLTTLSLRFETLASRTCSL